MSDLNVKLMNTIEGSEIRMKKYSEELNTIKEEKEPESNPFGKPKPQPRGKKDDK